MDDKRKIKSLERKLEKATAALRDVIDLLEDPAISLGLQHLRRVRPDAQHACNELLTKIGVVTHVRKSLIKEPLRPLPDKVPE